MKYRIIAAVTITLVLSVLTIINAIGGNKNEYTVNGSYTSSDTSGSANSSTNINMSTTSTTSTTSETTNTTKINKTTRRKTTRKTETQVAGTYKLTHYGWDCKGCGGNTASGYNVRNTIYYNDATYAKLRIVAMKDLPLYSVIKIKNYDGRDIFAIVLDKPKNYGIIDLLVENEKKASQLGIRKNVEIEVLRSGK